jgi:hypothetical protein
MSASTTVQGSNEVEAALLQVAKVKETAERVANGDSSTEVDQTRVVAGLVHQLAEQTERLFASVRAPAGEDTAAAKEHDDELRREEDRTPETAPAAPLDDRAR